MGRRLFCIGTSLLDYVQPTSEKKKKKKKKRRKKTKIE